MKRTWFMASVILTASIVLTGCQEGGRLFADLERYVNNQGVGGDDFTSSVRRFGTSQKDKTGELRGDMGRFVAKERMQGTDLATSLKGYRSTERELWPNLKYAAERAEESPRKRQFPSTEDY